MDAQPRPRWLAALLVVTVTAAVTAVLELAGLPSAALFGSVIGGMSHALTSPTRLEVPEPVFRAGQATLGVVVGSAMSLEALRAMGDDALTILLVTVATIGISLLAGRVLALRRDVSQVTGAFALIAGGASGVVAVARQLGADERVVTVVQFLRVLVVLACLPLVTTLVFDVNSGGRPDETAAAPLVPSLAYVAGCVLLGMLLARALRFSTSILLAPMVLAAVVSAEGWLGTVAVPEPVTWMAFALIGVQVGLRFTRASVASIARMLPVVVAIIVAMVVATAAVGAVLALLTPVDGLTAYLATTPGGIFAVIATASDAGVDVTYVMALQLVRLLVILAIVPLLARWLRRHDPDAD